MPVELSPALGVNFRGKLHLEPALKSLEEDEVDANDLIFIAKNLAILKPEKYEFSALSIVGHLHLGIFCKIAHYHYTDLWPGHFNAEHNGTKSISPIFSGLQCTHKRTQQCTWTIWLEKFQR